MFERRKWVLWSAIIALTFVSFGQAHTAEASRTLSEARSDTVLSHATEASREAHAGNPTIAVNGRDDTGVIEEIVVVGNKKSTA